MSDVDELPAGYRTYRVCIVGEDNPSLPESMRSLPRLQEELIVPGSSRQDAKERAEFACSLRFSGQLVRYFIEGEEHLDERF